MQDIPEPAKAASYKEEFHNWKTHFITKIVEKHLINCIERFTEQLRSIPSSPQIPDGINKAIYMSEITGRINALTSILNISAATIDDEAFSND